MISFSIMALYFDYWFLHRKGGIFNMAVRCRWHRTVLRYSLCAILPFCCWKKWKM